MSKSNQYNWVDFYKEFANKLLSYNKNRPNLISKVRDTYKEININLPKLEIDNEIVDIDPSSVFGLFNKSSLREDKIYVK